ncbi:MAG: alpha/beta hydrolase [Lamprobacter sp.]|uniref:alpha/beta fold hydrolase n=1 Tax=Lamprobacter sp. TaxID=3100796 RepID=UPI002B262C6E|nr:alpha/beta hydrolase [Lamprobacter sp.]MEA3640473.1 alpha/beta hydrolase [Lamprobacter sp.]
MSQPLQPVPLPEALDARREQIHTAQAGRIAYYQDLRGEGRPLVLVHSINAAPSSYEVKPIFEHYASTRPVYSIDLPGFGHSERSDRAYSPELYANAIRVLLEEVVQAPADLLALSLSAEFAARAALGSPASVASLVLISPTGFSARGMPPLVVGQGLHGLLGVRLWSQRLYDLVASKRSIRHYLGKSFGGEPPQELIDYAYATSHQPGARYAPLVFLSTQLFTRDPINKLYSRLTKLPVLAIADRDPYVTFEQLESLVFRQPNWQFERLGPHLGLPQWEQPATLFAALDHFWATG